MGRDPVDRVLQVAIVLAGVALVYTIIVRPLQSISTPITTSPSPSAVATASPFPVVRPWDLPPDLRTIYDQRLGGDLALLVVQTPRGPVYVTPDRTGIGECAATAALANKGTYRGVLCPPR
jgi:hypothetical protein